MNREYGGDHPNAPPSAGGPGKGLVDNALGLVEQVGVPVPDGDTVKVDKAAQAWDRLATVYQTTTVVEALEVNARAFSDTHTPEVEYIAKDLRELRDATSAILAGCSELAQSCKDYRAALDDLRNQLEDILTDLAVELAVTATISVFALHQFRGRGGGRHRQGRAHHQQVRQDHQVRSQRVEAIQARSVPASRKPTTSPASASASNASRNLARKEEARAAQTASCKAI